jgi:putative aldouronate transport system permease protein
VLATLSLFYAVNRWNGFQDALYYTSDPKLFTLQMELWEIIQNNMTSATTALEGNLNQNAIIPQSLKAASIIFATMPILVVYPWLQRYFRSGVMIGAIKG